MNIGVPGEQVAPLMSERRVSLIGALMVAIGPLSMALFTPAMPHIVDAFGTTEAAVKMTISLYFAGFAFAQLVCGPLSDGFGRKPISIAFMLIYLVASMIALVSPTIEVLIAARFLQGVGAAAGVAISRAVVRDLFTHDQSARIMNLTAIILAVGPALAPTIGGLTMELAGWHAIFALMIVHSVAIVAVVWFGMRETVTRDLSRIRPAALAKSYGTLLGSAYFMSTSLITAGAVGAIYTSATILPFVLMNRVGLSPSEFGLSMMLQSGSFFIGSMTVRVLMRRVRADRLIPAGLGFMTVGSALLMLLGLFHEPTVATVMGPVGLYAFGIAFVMPATMTASLAPFPRIAGSASSLSGFLQMGSGLAGGTIAALISDPVIALSTIVPGLGALAVVSWLVWRLLPEPSMATVVRSGPAGLS